MILKKSLAVDRIPRPRAATLALVNSIMLAGLASVVAETATNAPVQLPDVVVTGESENAETVQGPFLPAVQGTKINAGKKTSVLDFDELPKINNNNYRQALSKTPGLLLSEETSPLVSLGYRGLNPHLSLSSTTAMTALRVNTVDAIQSARSSSMNRYHIVEYSFHLCGLWHLLSVVRYFLFDTGTYIFLPITGTSSD